MKLTDKACYHAKPKEKPYKLSNGGGLYMLVKPSGRYWRVKYRVLGKEKVLALGTYPQVSLLEAREAAKVAKKTLTAGVDPMEAKRATKRKAALNAANNFEAVAREWHDKESGSGWSKDHADNVLHLMEIDIFPFIGKRPIAEIDTPELLHALKKIEARGALDISRRVRSICGRVFQYGIATGRCSSNVATNLKGILKTSKTKHFATLDIKDMPPFLHALEKNDARLYARTRRAVKFLMLTFVRTNEMLGARWDEIDLETAQWSIPAERMKMKKPHIVPLSRQAVAILKEQHAETGYLNTPYVFPSQIRPKDTMSNGTILGAIKRLGFKNRQTGHGFRAFARTAIREKLDYAPDVIEAQLAHKPAGPLGAAYDRASHLAKRKVMMQE